MRYKYTKIRSVYRHIERAHKFPNGKPCKFCGKEIKDIYKHKKFCHKAYQINKDYIKLENIIPTQNNKATKDIDQKGNDSKANIILKVILEDNYLYAGKYIYWEKLYLGGGAVMNTYIGSDEKQISLFAIKIQKKKCKYNFCQIESEILSRLKNFEGFPRIIGEGELNCSHFIAETLTGPNLENIMEYMESGFNISTVANIGIQLLNAIESLHNQGILHCDIKPSNIGYGLYENGKIIKDNEIILLDFGYSMKYIYEQYQNDEKGNPCEIGKFHYLPNKFTKNAGTFLFMSDDILDGKDPSRKSELENIMYVLIYLYKGTLPWNIINYSANQNKRLLIKKRRKTIGIDELFFGLPDEFLFIYNSIKKMTFITKPNYELFKSKLKQIILYHGQTTESDFCFKNKIIKDINSLYNNTIEKEALNKLKKLFRGYPIFKY